VRSTDPEARPDSRAQPPCPRGPEPLKLGTELGSGGIADDKLDSEKMPEAVLPPGCRRPVDLPPTARVVMRVCATRSGEYEWYEKRTIKTRRALSSHRRRARSWTAPARLPAIHCHHRRSLCGQVNGPVLSGTDRDLGRLFGRLFGRAARETRISLAYLQLADGGLCDDIVLWLVGGLLCGLR
jgi:hypothetical protein